MIVCAPVCFLKETPLSSSLAQGILYQRVQIPAQMASEHNFGQRNVLSAGPVGQWWQLLQNQWLLSHWGLRGRHKSPGLGTGSQFQTHQRMRHGRSRVWFIPPKTRNIWSTGFEFQALGQSGDTWNSGVGSGFLFLAAGRCVTVKPFTPLSQGTAICSTAPEWRKTEKQLLVQTSCPSLLISQQSPLLTCYFSTGTPEWDPENHLEH